MEEFLLSLPHVSIVPFNTRKKLERATGIEPAWPVWKTGTLPLSYARNVFHLTGGSCLVNSRPCILGAT